MNQAEIYCAEDFVSAIKKAFPNLETSELQGGGLNIRLPKRGVITVWWQKGKFCNSNGGQWRRFDDKYNAVAELTTIINALLNPKPKSKPKAKELPSSENGVQKCIDHLLKKADLISSKAGADHKSATVLKTTAQELYQYL